MEPEGLSPLLVNIYAEELAARIRNSGLGVKVNEDRLISLLDADDVVLIGWNKKMLQAGLFGLNQLV